MNNIDDIKSELKIAVNILQDAVGDILKQKASNDLVDNKDDISFDVSGDVGETMVEKEKKHWEKQWVKEWVCPLCGENVLGNVFIKPVLEVNEPDKIKVGSQGSIVSDLINSDVSDDVDRINEFRNIRSAFETEEEFDRHMQDVHGIAVEKHGEIPTEEEILKKYGAHYSDMRYGEQQKDKREDENKNAKKIKRLDIYVKENKTDE